VEVRRRTRPMLCFVNVESVDRIIYSIFQRFNLEWKTPNPQPIYTSGLTSPGILHSAGCVLTDPPICLLCTG
jgi:hypothetical protein